MQILRYATDRPFQNVIKNLQENENMNVKFAVT